MSAVHKSDRFNIQLFGIMVSVFKLWGCSMSSWENSSRRRSLQSSSSRLRMDSYSSANRLSRNRGEFIFLSFLHWFKRFFTYMQLMVMMMMMMMVIMCS